MPPLTTKRSEHDDKRNHDKVDVADDAAHRSATMTFPYYINDNKSNIRGIKPGWYAMDEDGNLSFGPFSNRENCFTRINQFVNWSTSLELHRRTN